MCHQTSGSSMVGWYIVKMNWIPIRVRVNTPRKDPQARTAPLGPGPKLEKSVAGIADGVGDASTGSLAMVVKILPHVGNAIVFPATLPPV